MQNYKVQGKLKKSRECSYYSATHKANDKPVTIQRLHNKKLTWQQLLNRKDVALMKTATISCLPKIIEIIKDEGKFFLILERLERNLEGAEVEMKEAVEIAVRMLEAVRELEEKGVRVGELRPECFFYDKEKLTIGHFVGERDTNKFQMTESHDFRYIAPEHVLSSKQPELASTVYSVGCILAELLLRIPLVQAKTKVDYIYSLTELFPKQNIGGKNKPSHVEQKNSFESKTGHLCHELQEILYEMMRINPAERMTAENALERLKRLDTSKLVKEKEKRKQSQNHKSERKFTQQTTKLQSNSKQPRAQSKSKKLNPRLETTQSKKLPQISSSKQKQPHHQPQQLNFLDDDNSTIDKMLEMLKLTKPLRSEQNIEDDVTQAIIIKKSEAPELPMLTHHSKTRPIRRGAGKPQLTNFALQQDGNLGVQLGSSFFSDVDHPPF